MNLVDVTAPVVTAPAAVTAEATGTMTTVTLGTATATDVVDGAITPTSDAPASFPVGVTTVTYTATDAAGNAGTATQTVTITDTTVPVIMAPADVAADSLNGGDVSVGLGMATATDIFGVTITNDAPPTFTAGTTVITWTATDEHGNSATATQNVIVTLIDTLPPSITVPADVFTSTSGSSGATVDIGMASATDNIDGMVAVTNDAPATFPVGVTTVTYTAADFAGNTATATQNIYVSYVSSVGGGSGGATTPPAQGGGATVGMEAAYWHHNDHLGTPQAMSDVNGTVVWTMSQTPFGVATVNEDPDGDGITVSNNFRFPGQYYDAETGLNYNYFRSYDPRLGRYTQSDPIGLRGGLNTFGYVEGNPVSGIDIRGLDTAVIMNGYTSGNPFGHMALAFTGKGVFSFGNDYYPVGRSLIEYLKREAPRRDTQVIVINKTTIEEENAMAEYLRGLSLDLEKWPDNCASRSAQALKKAGIPIIDTGLPEDIRKQILFWLLLNGGEIYDIPKGSTSISSGLNQFEPK